MGIWNVEMLNAWDFSFEKMRDEITRHRNSITGWRQKRMTYFQEANSKRRAEGGDQLFLRSKLKTGGEHSPGGWEVQPTTGVRPGFFLRPGGSGWDPPKGIGGSPLPPPPPGGGSPTLKRSPSPASKRGSMLCEDNLQGGGGLGGRPPAHQCLGAPDGDRDGLILLPRGPNQVTEGDGGGPRRIEEGAHGGGGGLGRKMDLLARECKAAAAATTTTTTTSPTDSSN